MNIFYVILLILVASFMLCHSTQREDSDWKPEIRLPNVSEYVMLIGLEWDAEYDVFVVAENQQGKSKPGTLTFRTSSEPAATTGNHNSSLPPPLLPSLLLCVHPHRRSQAH